MKPFTDFFPGDRMEAGRAKVLAAVIGLTWVTLTLSVLGVYFVADDWWSLERILDHGLLWSFDPTLPGRLFYRPLTHDLYFRVMQAVFGLHPEPYHLVNMLIFAADLVLIFVIGRRLFNRPAAGLWAAFFYAAAPLNFMPVAFITGIQEVGMQFFALLATLAFLRLSPSSSSPPADSTAESGGAGWSAALRFGGPLLYLVALLCKESVIWLPVWLWLFDLGSAFTRGEKIRDVVGRRFPLHLPFDLLLLLYLAFRLRFLPPPTEGEYQMSFFGWHILVRLEKYLEAIAEAAGIPRVSQAGGAFLYTVAAAAGLMVLLAGWVRKRTINPPPALALAWFGLGLSIFLPLLHRSFEYFVSFAAIGFFWAAGFGLEQMFRRLKPAAARPVFFLYLFLVLGVSGFGHYSRHRNSFTTTAARATRALHEGIKSRHPVFPPHSRIIILSDVRMKGDSSLFGIRALYRQPDLQVFLDEQAYIIEQRPEGFAFRPRPDFNYVGVYVFAYTRREGFMELFVGPDGFLPLSAWRVR